MNERNQRWRDRWWTETRAGDNVAKCDPNNLSRQV